MKLSRFLGVLHTEFESSVLIVVPVFSESSKKIKNLLSLVGQEAHVTHHNILFQIA